MNAGTFWRQSGRVLIEVFHTRKMLLHKGICAIVRWIFHMRSLPLQSELFKKFENSVSYFMGMLRPYLFKGDIVV